MAQSDFQDGGRFASADMNAQGAVPNIKDGSVGHQPPRASAADFVLSAPKGSVVALGGIDGESLRRLLDEVEPTQYGRIALFGRIEPEPTTEAIIEQIINLLAETARRMWPIWFTDVSFGGCGTDTLGRLAVGAIARRATEEIAGLSSLWTEAAARLVLDNHPPRVNGTPAAIELRQLALAISRTGLVLVTDVDAAVQTAPNPAAVVRALEWVAQVLQGSVIALFADLPPSEPPFDRILYGSRSVISDSAAIEPDASEPPDHEHEPWIAPWRVLTHPLSEIEQRLAKVIGADTELAPLFSFNQLIDTARG